MVALNKAHTRSSAHLDSHRKVHTPDRSAKDSGHRYYSPEISRWLSRDPIGEADSGNIYVFVENASTLKVDPRGLTSVGPCCKQEDIDNRIGENPWKDVIETLQNATNADGRKCLRAVQPIECGTCAPNVGGRYNPPITNPSDSSQNKDGSITICAVVTSSILTHELQHAKQCVGNSCGGLYTDWSKCKAALKLEMAAWICGHKGTGLACDKTSAFFSYFTCMATAWESVESSCPACVGKANHSTVPGEILVPSNPFSGYTMPVFNTDTMASGCLALSE